MSRTLSYNCWAFKPVGWVFHTGEVGGEFDPLFLSFSLDFSYCHNLFIV